MWTKGHELKYWNKNGIRKGTRIYLQYAKSFDLHDYDLRDKKIVDIGCGPFGGCFCGSLQLDVTPVDVLADEYKLMGVSSREIIFGDLSEKLPFNDNTFDFAICTNAIDHIPDVKHGFDELNRILKKDGTFFLHVHLRRKDQLNKAHIHILTMKGVCDIATDSGFDVVKQKEDTDWVNDRTDRLAAYLTLTKHG